MTNILMKATWMPWQSQQLRCHDRLGEPLHSPVSSPWHSLEESSQAHPFGKHPHLCPIAEHIHLHDCMLQHSAEEYDPVYVCVCVCVCIILLCAWVRGYVHIYIPLYVKHGEYVRALYSSFKVLTPSCLCLCSMV